VPFNPKFAEAAAANFKLLDCPRLPRRWIPMEHSFGANPSKRRIVRRMHRHPIGPCRWVEELRHNKSVFRQRLAYAVAILFVLRSRFKSNSRASQLGICTPSIPRFAGPPRNIIQLIEWRLIRRELRQKYRWPFDRLHLSCLQAEKMSNPSEGLWFKVRFGPGLVGGRSFG